MVRRKRSERLDCKPPSRRAKAKWAKLIKLCTQIVITWPTQAATQKSPLVQIIWPVVADAVLERPEDWPISKGFVKTDTTFTAKYNCETLLDWFYARRYIDYNADSLMRQRASFMGKMSQEEYWAEQFLRYGDDIGSDS